MAGFSFGKLKVPAALARISQSYRPEVDVEALFWAAMAAAPPLRALEAGTRRLVDTRPTHHRDRFPHLSDSDYVRLDIEPGPDVDVVGDLHALPPDWTGRFDCFIACAVWEHLRRPWIAARETARVLAPGGRFLVTTHQCYPLHAHPDDYFRFSKEALRLLFEDAGLIVEAADYQHRCSIVPAQAIVPARDLATWNERFPSFILVSATGRKPPA